MKKLILLSVLAVSVAAAQAGESAFQAALTPDIALQPSTNQINGVSLNFWGENPQHALALGFVNGSTGDSHGFSLAFFANYADAYTGVAWAPVNLSKTKFKGWQGGLLNYSEGTFVGFQSGWVNLSFCKEFHGLQLGVVNYAENLRGVQIGLINVVNNNSWFKNFPDQLATGFPVLNWSF
jgi:hypothetical protein